VATVGKDKNTDPFFESAQQIIELVIDEFLVIEAPGFILVIVFVVISVWDLSTVSGIGEQKDISRLQ